MDQLSFISLSTHLTFRDETFVAPEQVRMYVHTYIHKCTIHITFRVRESDITVMCMFKKLINHACNSKTKLF